MPWYALACASSFEDKIADKIGDQAYVPRRTIWRKVKRRGHGPGRIKKQYPLIPGYVLVELDLRGKIYTLLRAERRVYGFVAAAGRPLVIRDTEIAYLKSKESMGHYDETKELLQKLIGGRFEIMSGNLEGKEAKVISIKNRDLIMEVDGYAMPVTVSIDSFEKTRHNRIV
jgi:transcription antitermination factor NusG